MRVRYNGEEVSAACARLPADAAVLRELGDALARVADGLADPHVAAGLGAVTGACGKALQLIAADLEQAAARLRAAARVYDRVEREVVGAPRVPHRR